MANGSIVTRPVAVVLVATAASAVLACVLSVARVPTVSLVETTALVRALAASALMIGGILGLARWRMTGESHYGLRGLGRLLMGGIALPSVAIARGLSAPGDVTPATCVRALTFGAVLVVTAVALSDERRERWRVDLNVVKIQVLAGAGLVGLLLLGRHRLAGEESPRLLAAQGVMCALAVAWLTLAIGAAAKGRREEWARPVAPLLGIMGVAELFRLPDRPSATLVAVALTAAVGFLVAASGVVDLVRGAQQEQDASEHLSRELADVRQEVSHRETWQVDLTHDARSSLAGIRAAMYTLDRHAAELDASTADRLRVATLAELTHLEHLLVGASGDETVFDVAEVVRNVTDVRRAAGVLVDVSAGRELVRGAPGDIATALQNLLVNAEEHAPGSPVAVEVHRRGALVCVAVSDDGPGVPAEAADLVFDRGFRGPDSRGSGVGLSIARALVRRHGGELELASTEARTTFVLSLPAVDAAELPGAGDGDAGVLPVPAA
jgi:signal transduction histidine kinase